MPVSAKSPTDHQNVTGGLVWWNTHSKLDKWGVYCMYVHVHGRMETHTRRRNEREGERGGGGGGGGGDERTDLTDRPRQKEEHLDGQNKGV